MRQGGIICSSGAAWYYSSKMIQGEFSVKQLC